MYAFSHDQSKEKDVKEMGADQFIDSSKTGFAENLKGELDFILSTRDVAEGFPLAEYLSYVSSSGPFTIEYEFNTSTWLLTVCSASMANS